MKFLGTNQPTCSRGPLGIGVIERDVRNMRACPKLSENISNRIEENQVEVFVEKEIIITKEVVNPISYIILGFSIVLIIISGLIFRKAKN